MSTYFVVGDIHGKAQMLEELMTEWDGKAQLVFLGDLIDRGENSKRSIEIVKDYVDHHGAVCLSGNHEYMFLAWLDNPEERYDHYRRNGGDTTINSLLGRPLDAPVDGVADAQAVESTVPELVAFIRRLPFDYETESYYFVHAGVDLTLENWRETSDYQKVWIRKPFHEAENQTGKWIIFGHTPVYGLLHEPVGTENLWISDQKMGVDGGAVYGGVLHGLLLDDQGIVQDHVLHNTGFSAADD